MERSRSLRHGLQLSITSIVWTTIASTAEVGIGLTHGVLTLVVFGFAGLLDAAGSVALVSHFRHELRHGEASERHERMVTLGVLTSIESVRRLVVGAHAHSAPAGTLIAAVSIFVLSGLSASKVRVGRKVGSPALTADAWLSGTGAILAVVAVVGAGLGDRSGTAWADPAAALVIGLGAAVYGAITLRATLGTGG
jgi:hypothetical protein